MRLSSYKNEQSHELGTVLAQVHEVLFTRLSEVFRSGCRTWLMAAGGDATFLAEVAAG